MNNKKRRHIIITKVHMTLGLSGRKPFKPPSTLVWCHVELAACPINTKYARYSLQLHKKSSFSDYTVFFTAEFSDDYRNGFTFSNKSTAFLFIGALCLFILLGFIIKWYTVALCLEGTFEICAVSSNSILERSLFVC